MNYVISSNVNVYKDHHIEAWNSGRDLKAALHQSQHYPSSSIRPPAYHRHSHEAEPKQPPIENGMHYRHDTSGAHTNCPDDVLLYVGKSRQTFHLNAQTLISGSAYFRRLLQHAPSPLPPTASQASTGHCNGGLARAPIVIDCEEGIFESLLLLMKYGTLEALPPMSAAEFFRLKKEAEFYRIHYVEPPSKISSATESGDDHSDMSSTRSSDSGSPKLSPPTADKGAGRHVLTASYHEGVPVDLANPAKLVVVSCLDQEKASIYTCDCVATRSRHSAGISTQWAINFHHRHAFCTACGRKPNMSPKHFAEIFMAAAADYTAPAPSPGQAAPMEPNAAWRVSSDSTCMLRFISSGGHGPDACGCSAGGGRAAPTIWAANCFYSHAFCTSCGEAAKGPVLLSLILALRYGGSNKLSRSARSRE